MSGERGGGKGNGKGQFSITFSVLVDYEFLIEIRTVPRTSYR